MPDWSQRAAGICSAGWGFSRRHAPRSGALALGVIVGLLAAVTVLRWFVDGAGQAVALLYVVPIALGALRFGRRGGLAVAGFGIVAFVALESVRARGDVDVTGWVSPILAMALVGGLVGHLSEQSKRLEELCDAQHAAIEAGDSIVQQVAAARWMLEAGRSGEALATLGDTVAEGIANLSCTLPPPPPQPATSRSSDWPPASSAP